MADKSMKAVIQVDVDPKGAVKGVTAVERELAKLNKSAARSAQSAGITAAITSLNAVASVIQTVGSQILARNDEIAKLGGMSSQAMGAKAQTDFAKIQQQQMLGPAMSGDIAMAEQVKRQYMQSETERLLANQGNVAAMQVLTSELEDAYNRMKELPGNIMFGGMPTYKEDNTGRFFREYLKSAGMGAYGGLMKDTAMFNEGIALRDNALNYTGIGSARGMPYETAAEKHLRKMAGDQ